MALNTAIGSFVLPTSGSAVSVTSLPFEPSLVIFIFIVPSGTINAAQPGTMTQIFGAYDGVRNVCISAKDYHNISPTKAYRGIYGGVGSAGLCLVNITDTTSNAFEAYCSAMLSNGFTVNIAKNPVAAQQIEYIAIGGCQAECGVMDGALTNGVHQHNFVDSTLTPGAMFFGMVANGNSIINGNLTNLIYSIGMAAGAGSGEQSLNSIRSKHNIAASEPTRHQSLAKVLGLIDYDNEPSYLSGGMYASLSAFLRGGFELTYNSVTGFLFKFIYIAFGGVVAEIGTNTQPTTSTTVDTNFTFTPEAAFSLSYGAPDSWVQATSSRLSVGFTDGAAQRAISSHSNWSSNPATSIVGQFTNRFVHVINSSEAPSAQFSAVASFDTNKISLNWTVYDTIERSIRVLALKQLESTYNVTLSNPLASANGQNGWSGSCDVTYT